MTAHKEKELMIILYINMPCEIYQNNNIVIEEKIEIQKNINGYDFLHVRKINDHDKSKIQISSNSGIDFNKLIYDGFVKKSLFGNQEVVSIFREGSFDTINDKASIKIHTIDMKYETLYTIDNEKKDMYDAFCENIYAKNISDIKTFLEKEPNFLYHIDQNGNTPLIFASMARKNETIELLLQNFSKNVHHKNNVGNTAIDYSTKYGDIESVLVLLRYGSKCYKLVCGELNGFPFEYELKRYTPEKMKYYIDDTSLRLVDNDD